MGCLSSTKYRILDQQNQTPKSKNEITKCRCKFQIPKSKNNFQIPDRKKPDAKLKKTIAQMHNLKLKIENSDSPLRKARLKPYAKISRRENSDDDSKI